MIGIGEKIEKYASTMPDRVAVTVNDTQLTWRDLDQRTRTIAHLLSERVSAKDRFAFSSHKPLNTVLVLLASARCGRCIILSDPTWPVAISSAVDDRLRPAYLLTDRELENLRDRGDEISLSNASLDAPLFVGFTSGSTGIPKGYERSHASWVKSVDCTQSAFNISSDDVVCLPGSLNFSHFLYGLFHALYCGANVRLYSRFSPRRIVTDIAQSKANVLFAVPTQAKLLLDTAAREHLSLDCLRLILTSGAKWRHDISPTVRATIPNAKIIEFFGASELSFVSYSSLDDRPKDMSVGKPFDNVQISIRDTGGSEVKSGTPGRIWVKSPMIFERYVMGENPECERDGDFVTVGDHGKIDANGTLHLLGREARMLISAGENLYPEVVESTLERLDGILSAAVIGLDDALRGSRIVAAVRFAAHACPTTSKALRHHCETHLGARSVPTRFFLLHDWPVLHGGKTDFAAIAKMIKGGEVEQLP